MKSIIPVAAGILSVGVLVYLYIKRREKDRKGNDKDPDAVEKLEFVMKNQQVPAIVGRNSVVLKSIEEKTQTKIRFRESDEDHQICSIKGKASNVKIAKQIIDQEASKPCVITEEILVPTSSCGKIEGYCGSVLHEICSKSSAKVWIDSGSRKQNAETRRVLITGTQEQVQMAKKLIDEKIKEIPEETSDDKKEESLKREPRLPSPSQYASNSSITTTDSPREVMLPNPEKLKNNDGQLEVFVSAVNSPSRFWVQLVGPQSTELDFLVDAMTEYYNTKENQDLHQIREPYLGQIVAAMFFSDNKWYRAEIVAIQVNESMPQELLFDVYFLDYGDSQFVGKKDILELRADFLSLRFQAIECFLAHIQPVNGISNVDEWDEKAVEKFEELVQVAHWKKLVSKVVAYKERKSFAFQRENKKRESSPIPGVELYDPEENPDKNIALELVRLGHAETSGQQFGDLVKSAVLNVVSDEAGDAIKDGDEKSLDREKDLREKSKSPGPQRQKEKTPEILKAKSPEKTKEKTPEIVKEKTPEVVKEKTPEIVKEKSPEAPKVEESQKPAPQDSPSASKENNNNNIITNGAKPKLPQQELYDPFKASGKPKKSSSSKEGGKKKPQQQQLNDFLKNEQQTTSKNQAVKKEEDWNSMMED